MGTISASFFTGSFVELEARIGDGAAAATVNAVRGKTPNVRALPKPDVAAALGAMFIVSAFAFRELRARARAASPLIVSSACIEFYVG
jgi:hypothetical protein